MKNKYIDLVGQTFDFPQDEFRVEDGTLYVNDINMMDIIKEYGTPLKITYLPKISSPRLATTEIIIIVIARRVPNSSLFWKKYLKTMFI